MDQFLVDTESIHVQRLVSTVKSIINSYDISRHMYDL